MITVSSCLRVIATPLIFLLTLPLAPLIWAPSATAADYFACTPATHVFSFDGAYSLTEDLKKLSRREFGMNGITTAGLPKLARGTELNVLVDLKCMKDPARGPRAPPFLKRLDLGAQPASGERSFVWSLEHEEDFADLQNEFEAEPCVRLVSPNGTFKVLAEFSDPLILKQEHLRFLHFNEAMVDFLKPLLVRKKVTIAVVDSGVDFTHPDLYDNRWINPREIAANGIDDDGNGYVDDVNGYNFASQIGDPGPQGDQPESRHGTHVAGLAAARIDNGIGGTGINGVAQIMALNIFGPNNTTRSALLENAIRYAADNGADVINMSLGGREYGRTMRSALDYAISEGSFIVTAAGNYGFEICDDPESFGFVSPGIYASSIDGMMVTGSIDAATGKLSVFSNYSSRLVEIVAPGAYLSDAKIGLLSTFPGGKYAYLAGTSMAAPVLSGAAAMAINWLKVYGYPVSPQRVESILRSSARKDSALANWVQEGRSLDLGSLARYLKSHYPVSGRLPVEAQPAPPPQPFPFPPIEPQPTPEPTPEPTPYEGDAPFVMPVSAPVNSL